MPYHWQTSIIQLDLELEISYLDAITNPLCQLVVMQLRSSWILAPAEQ